MLAMREITYPHDSWILVDKEPSPAIEKMARELGISYFCRHDERTWGADGVKGWNQQVPPFQTKTRPATSTRGSTNTGPTIPTSLNWTSTTYQSPTTCTASSDISVTSKLRGSRPPASTATMSTGLPGDRGAGNRPPGPPSDGRLRLQPDTVHHRQSCTYDMEAIRGIGGFQPTRPKTTWTRLFSRPRATKESSCRRSSRSGRGRRRSALTAPSNLPGHIR